MHTRLLVPGLLLNAFALGSIVLLGLGALLVLAISGEPPGVGDVLRALWLIFTVGTVVTAVSSPPGARLSGAVLCGLSLSSSFLLFGDRNEAAIYGSLVCVFALLLYCAYQDHLSRALDDDAIKKLIKRAYDRPLKLFLLGIACWLGALALPFGQMVIWPICVVTFVGCPVWGFAYLSVVTVHLVRALRRRETDGEPARIPAEF